MAPLYRNEQAEPTDEQAQKNRILKKPQISRKLL